MAKSTRKPSAYDKFRAAEIKKIQIAKRWAIATLPGFDDDRYRDLLQEAGGRRSCTELDYRGRMAVLERFKELGWQPKPAKPVKHTRTLADDPQSKKIRALWLDLHAAGKVRDPSEKALGAYVRRMTNVAALQWLTTAQASTVIEVLKKWLER